jgi:DNA-binding Lrp family transcriptional regulator
VEAYVLIQTEIGRVASVLAELRKLPLVSRADDVTGPYDIIALLEGETLEDIGRHVVEAIQVIEGVTRTLTCPLGHLKLDAYHSVRTRPGESGSPA